MIRIERVTPAEALREPAITAFLEAHPATTAYAMPTWLSVTERFLGGAAGYRVASRDGRIVGVLPLVVRPLHARAALLPAAIRPLRAESLGHDCYAGPLIAAAEDPASAREVLAALVASAAPRGVLIQTMFPPAWAASLDPIRRGLVEDHGYRARHPYAIGVKDLAGLGEKALLATYHQSHRRAVEAARKRGVVVSPAAGAADYLEFYDLLGETLDHAGTTSKFSKDFVVEGGPELSRAGLGHLLLARIDGAPVAGMFALEAGASGCYWLGATAKDEKALKHRPMNALFHRAFVDAIGRGRRWFELGGLLTEGLRTFKARWGMSEHEQVTFEWSYRDLLEPLRGARARLQGR